VHPVSILDRLGRVRRIGQDAVEKHKARRIFAQARVAAAQRIVETGRLYLAEGSEERWRDFQQAIDDISRLEASPLAREALASDDSLEKAVGS
jgi:hypothetical protein